MVDVMEVYIETLRSQEAIVKADVVLRQKFYKIANDYLCSSTMQSCNYLGFTIESNWNWKAYNVYSLCGKNSKVLRTHYRNCVPLFPNQYWGRRTLHTYTRWCVTVLHCGTTQLCRLGCLFSKNANSKIIRVALYTFIIIAARYRLVKEFEYLEH